MWLSLSLSLSLFFSLSLCRSRARALSLSPSVSPASVSAEAVCLCAAGTPVHETHLEVFSSVFVCGLLCILHLPASVCAQPVCLRAAGTPLPPPKKDVSCLSEATGPPPLVANWKQGYLAHKKTPPPIALQ